MNLDKKIEKEKELNKRRVEKFRSKIYGNKKKHEELKEQDRIRKQMARADEQLKYGEKIDRREKERLRKKNYRKALKIKQEEMKQKEKSETERVKKNALRRQRRRLLKKDAELIVNVASLTGKRKRTENCEDNDCSDDESRMDETESFGQFIWKNMSPLSKKKAKLNMSQQEISPKIRKEFRNVGVNLSNRIKVREIEQSELEKEVESFFNRDDVSRVCPDAKKQATNPLNKEEKHPIRWQLGHFNVLHAKFLAESNLECSYTTFLKKIPYYVKKPGNSDWGTSLCSTCLNPELKIERLIDMKELKNLGCFEDLVQDDDRYQQLITALIEIG